MGSGDVRTGGTRKPPLSRMAAAFLRKLHEGSRFSAKQPAQDPEPVTLTHVCGFLFTLRSPRAAAAAGAPGVAADAARGGRVRRRGALRERVGRAPHPEPARGHAHLPGRRRPLAHAQPLRPACALHAALGASSRTTPFCGSPLATSAAAATLLLSAVGWAPA